MRQPEVNLQICELVTGRLPGSEEGGEGESRHLYGMGDHREG